jgi:uncharacterized protein GlcG (DUF336 family)
MFRKRRSRAAAFLCAAVLLPAVALADCSKLPSFEKLRTELRAAVKPSGGPANGGLEFNMWATITDRDGTICAVAYSGAHRGDQFPISRAVSAQKAYTANALSLDGFALSTANLYSPTQPGQSLFGLTDSNLMAPAVAYAGESSAQGTAKDPMVGHKLGGMIIFGGGLALYDKSGVLGGLGVSGDSSCADHNIAWRIRKALGLDAVPAGVNPNKNDGIIYDIAAGGSKSGFGHPTCGGKEADIAVSIGAGTVTP